MARTIEQVSFPEKLPRRTRVAAYARVSSGKDVGAGDQITDLLP